MILLDDLPPATLLPFLEARDAFLLQRCSPGCDLLVRGEEANNAYFHALGSSRYRGLWHAMLQETAHSVVVSPLGAPSRGSAYATFSASLKREALLCNGLLQLQRYRSDLISRCVSALGEFASAHSHLLLVLYAIAVSLSGTRKPGFSTVSHRQPSEDRWPERYLTGLLTPLEPLLRSRHVAQKPWCVESADSQRSPLAGFLELQYHAKSVFFAATNRWAARRWHELVSQSSNSSDSDSDSEETGLEAGMLLLAQWRNPLVTNSFFSSRINEIAVRVWRCLGLISDEDFDAILEQAIKAMLGCPLGPGVKVIDGIGQSGLYANARDASDGSIRDPILAVANVCRERGVSLRRDGRVVREAKGCARVGQREATESARVSAAGIENASAVGRGRGGGEAYDDDVVTEVAVQPRQLNDIRRTGGGNDDTVHEIKFLVLYPALEGLLEGRRRRGEGRAKRSHDGFVIEGSTGGGVRSSSSISSSNGGGAGSSVGGGVALLEGDLTIGNSIDAIRAAVAELPAGRVLQAISQTLYGTLHFAGNRNEYYDPRNSFLDCVLERRVGIPISLAGLYASVWRACGKPQPLGCVNMPGHFLLCCLHEHASSSSSSSSSSSTTAAAAGNRSNSIQWTPEEGLPVFIDAFSDGELLTTRGAMSMMASFGVPRDDRYLAPVAPTLVWLRCLRNLDGTFSLPALAEGLADCTHLSASNFLHTQVSLLASSGGHADNAAAPAFEGAGASWSQVHRWGVLGQILAITDALAGIDGAADHRQQQLQYRLRRNELGAHIGEIKDVQDDTSWLLEMIVPPMNQPAQNADIISYLRQLSQFCDVCVTEIRETEADSSSSSSSSSSSLSSPSPPPPPPLSSSPSSFVTKLHQLAWRAANVADAGGPKPSQLSVASKARFEQLTSALERLFDERGHSRPCEFSERSAQRAEVSSTASISMASSSSSSSSVWSSSKFLEVWGRLAGSFFKLSIHRPGVSPSHRALARRDSNNRNEDGDSSNEDEGDLGENIAHSRLRVGSVVQLRSFDSWVARGAMPLAGRKQNALYVIVAWQRGFSKVEYARHCENWRNRWLARSTACANPPPPTSLLDPNGDTIFYTLMGNDESEFGASSGNTKYFHHVPVTEIVLSRHGAFFDEPGPIDNSFLGKFFRGYDTSKQRYLLTREMEELYPDE